MTKGEFKALNVNRLVDGLFFMVESTNENAGEVFSSYINNALALINGIPAQSLIKQVRTNKRKTQQNYKWAIDNELIKYLVQIYRDGVIDVDGNVVVKKDPLMSNYYFFICYKGLHYKQLFDKNNFSEEDKHMCEYYESHFEDIERAFFHILNYQYKMKSMHVNNIEKIQISELYKADMWNVLDCKSDYVKLAAITEILKYGDYCNHTAKSSLKIFEKLMLKYVERASHNELEDENVRNLLVEIFSFGITDNFGRIIVSPRPGLAKKLGKVKIRIKKECKEDVSDKGKIYVCSDIHGQYDTYMEVMSKLEENDKLYILGDVIDRGPDGIKILLDVIKRSKTGQIEFIIGNHECMMYEAIVNNKGKDVWLSSNNGGTPTLMAFEKLSEEEQSKIILFLEQALIAKNITINNQRYQFVHANRCLNYDDENIYYYDVKQHKFEDITLGELVESREPREIKNGVILITGHTPTNSTNIEASEGRIRIDCGAANGSFGKVGVLCLSNIKEMYFSIRDDER